MSHVESLITQLRAIDLFHGFDDGLLAIIAGSAIERHFRSGETIFLRDDPGDAMFVVARGRVRLSVGTEEGRELSLKHVESGSAFGEMALLDDGTRSADATAVIACTLLAISRTRFQAILDSNPVVAKALLRGLCARLRAANDQLEAIALMPLEQRLARLLLHMVAANTKSARAQIKLNMSQAELGNLIGASRPKVNQILMDWDGAGIAVRTPGGLLVDIPALQNIGR
jgi:CRP/FNR family transcriptional regulator, cyclic AMP receptor protein